MASVADTPDLPRAERPRPSLVGGYPVLRWLRANLFSSIPSTIVTLILLALAAKLIFSLAQWGIWNAVWTEPAGNSVACRAARGLGACWAVIPEKFRFILFGTFPYDEQWRPALATAIFIALFYLSTRPRWWRRELV